MCKAFRSCLGFFCLLFISQFTMGQDAVERKISANYQDVPLIDVVADLSERYELKFFYRPNWISNKRVTTQFNDLILEDALTKVLRESDIAFIIREPSFVILLSDTGNEETTITDPSANKRVVIGELDILSGEAILQGTIYNGEDGFPMSGVIVSVGNSDVREISGADGKYRIGLPRGDYEVSFRHQTMEDFVISIALNGSGTLNVNMYEDVLRLEEVIIQEEAPDQNVSETLTGQESINLETLKKIPSFFGEVDIIYSVLSLPGVTRVGEGTSGFNVRGGTTGQNLVLIDGATIYNPSHLFGFFSSFNADIVSDIDFYKGAIPARYGGRISSVLDVEISDGNTEKITGKGGVGLINSRFSIEGPIVKDQTSFVFGARAGYPNYIIRQLEDLDLSNSSAYFFDGNLKVKHLINDENRISLGGYYSRDNFSLAEEATFDYGNASVTGEWNATLGNDLFMDVKGTYSSYDFTLTETETPQQAASLDALVSEIKGQVDFEKFLDGGHRMEFGGSTIRYQVEPGTYNPEGEASIIDPLSITSESAFESALYVSDEFKINNQWSVYGGLRFSLYQGGRTDYEITNYGLEPRLSVNLRTSPTASVKMGYNRMRQYVHFISNTTAATPIDLWKLSNELLPPTVADQVTLGYFKNFNDNSIEVSGEAFYKRSKDQVEYKNGADLFINPELEAELVQGEGEAYGLELLLRKVKGDFRGWISYTYSRSFIEVNSEAESINNGEKFPTNFDTPHNLSMLGSFQITRRFSINANFQYNTGRPITYPESAYEVSGITVPNYSDRNAYRIPDYHRLDLSFTMATSLRRKKKLEANWTISVYNVYGRENAYSVYFKNDPETGQPQAFKLSVVGRPILAITYNFVF